MIKHWRATFALCALWLNPALAAEHPSGLATVAHGEAQWTDPRFYANWMYDQGFLDQLAHDADPALEADKRVVAGFEAALGRAQLEGRMERDIDGILDKYAAPSYLQHDPNIPPGRDGLSAWFKKGGLAKGDVNKYPPVPVTLVAEGDFVAIVLKFAPLPDPNDPSASYSAYAVSTFRVDNGQITEHFSTASRGASWCRIGCGKKKGK